MVATVKFFIFAYGNIARGEEGASYDRDPMGIIRLQTDASYEDLLNAICTKVEIDLSAHQIKVLHRFPNSVGGPVRYYLLPICDDSGVEDLIETAEEMGKGSIQELYIEVSDRSIALSEHETRQVDATIPSTHQVPPSKRDPTTENDDSTRKRARHEIIPPSKYFNNMGENLITANLRSEDPSRSLTIHKLDYPMAFPMPTSQMPMNSMEDGNQTSRASSSTTPLPGKDYEVFLSFRGEDTRLGFTDHLYKELVNVGVWAFRDNKELHVGKEIGPELLKAIKGSRISIPVISKKYASSTWCLKELVQILECMDKSNQIVLPIFYQVEPSEVRNQTGDFGKGFDECKSKHDVEGGLVQEWRSALKKVTTLKGWESSKIANGYETELVQIAVDEVLKELRKNALCVSPSLVGIECHVEKIIEWIKNDKGFSGARAIVIHGMGGIGKTTLAKVVYNQLYVDFERCSFVEDVVCEASQCNGMKSLQKQLISDISGQRIDIQNIDQGASIIKARCERKKVLILLDNVDHRDQLNALSREPNWFKGESVIIITTRNKDVLQKWEHSLFYELCSLDTDKSFQLFKNHAFKGDGSCLDEYGTLAKGIVRTTGGLPLAIEVIGCYLHGKDKNIWEDTLKMLQDMPHDDVQRKLKISFDGLHQDEKEIFLDIACLSIHSVGEYAIFMWESCGFHKQRINYLISKSMIKYGDFNRFIIHDQLRDLGRAIVRQEGKGGLGNCSRLWRFEDAMHVLESKQGTRNVKALVLQHYSNEKIRCKSEQFEGMTNLRFLRLWNVRLIGDFDKFFLNLRWFSWSGWTPIGHEYDIMGINFNPPKLVVLQLEFNNITEHWKGWSKMKDLKVLTLASCTKITKIPSFIGKCSKTLEVLHVSNCKSLEELPIEVGKMEELRHLNISITKIREIPISQGCLTKLEILDAPFCDRLTYIPDSIGSLVKLRRLNLNGCSSLTKIPDSIGDLCSLERLEISCSPIKRLPTSIGKLRKLQTLDLLGCRELESLSDLPCGLTSLTFNGDSMETLPDISHLTYLKKLVYKDLLEKRNRTLILGKLNQLQSLEVSRSIHNRPSRAKGKEEEEETDMAPEDFCLLLELPVSLAEIEVFGCQTLRTLSNLSNLKNLSKLDLEDCSELTEINGLEGAESLRTLRIVRCKKLSRLSGVGTTVRYLTFESLDGLQSLPDLSTAKKLEKLEIKECNNLMEIQGLDGVEGLQTVTTDRCFSAKGKEEEEATDMVLENFNFLRELPEGLGSLTVFGCQTLRTLSNLSNLKNLSKLDLEDCSELTEINGLEGAESLRTLRIIRCRKLSRLSGVGTTVRYLTFESLDALQSLPDLSTAKKLKKLEIKECSNLMEIQGLDGVDGMVLN